MTGEEEARPTTGLARVMAHIVEKWR